MNIKSPKYVFLCIFLLSFLSISLHSQIIVDGVLDNLYGSPICNQDTPTGFGDNNLGMNTFANGSELNSAYARNDGETLCFIITGNLETNFNKLEIFLDTRSGGQNKLRGDNPDVDFDGLNRLGDDGSGNGLTFDTGFEADYYFLATNGGGPNYELYANKAELLTSGGGTGMFLGSSGIGNTTISSGGIEIGINNSNSGGVDISNVNNPASVSTGFEICIPLTEIGNPEGDIKIAAFISSEDHTFVSNQVLCGIGGGGNLGEVRNVNFSSIDGDQFFTVSITAIPTLSQWGIILLSLLMMIIGVGFLFQKKYRLQL